MLPISTASQIGIPDPVIRRMTSSCVSYYIDVELDEKWKKKAIALASKSSSRFLVLQRSSSRVVTSYTVVCYPSCRSGCQLPVPCRPPFLVGGGVRNASVF